MNTTNTTTRNNTTNRNTTPRVLSSSSIVGTNVLNKNNESVGEIKDLMIDLRRGEIQYCVLSFGGFLGMGDKLFAVPLESFDVDTHREKFILDIDKTRLEKAPGFDKDNWPSTADDTFVNSVYSFYGQQRREFRADPRLS